MDLTCALAMTRAEFSAAQLLPPNIAWMACHFSTAGDGLSNLPDALPPNALIMLDDSFPPQSHDPVQIASQLMPLLSQGIQGVLLDFQRPNLKANELVAKYLSEKLPCTVCVTPAYAEDLDCPILLPPPALHQHLEEILTPWKGRQLWLEATLDRQRITVTRKGSFVTPEAFTPLEGNSFTDNDLCCRYQIHTEENQAIFTLVRDREMLRALLEKAATLGIRQAVGLYQQLQPPL